ncbi:hypothetical protein [Sphingobium sp. D43FB]|uniref:hypothetical protein n=1 Tax=Sphingobium sp. D43FB TaxID=2017595 RepID=UPI000BB59C26|nr:hypothetical protein [Sphingobium sp. D43FB]PBN41246.1 hypothetical protein SxD43FB_22865 [Sphingobium sp. D43FB]
MDGEAAPLATIAITDYLLKSSGKAGERSARTRLAHVIGYIAGTNPSVTVPMIDERWVNGFRTFMRDKGYALGNIEGCVLQLAAAINALRGHQAQFKARSLKDVAVSPTHRSDIATMAGMFRFCIDPPPPPGREWSEKERAMVIGTRVNLLRYLRAAVATWARPDAIFDLRVGRQWVREAQVLMLNEPDREQTKKHRPAIPVARQFVPWLEEALARDHYLPITTVRHGWHAMRVHLGLPLGAQSGEKLIRRSVATIARRILGEANWVQGEFMLGHRKATISDIYAIPAIENFGLALSATEHIIDEIEALCPGAYRVSTAGAAASDLQKGAENG